MSLRIGTSHNCYGILKSGSQALLTCADQELLAASVMISSDDGDQPGRGFMSRLVFPALLVK